MQQREETLREFGSLLRQLREAQVLTLDQVAAQTHIRPFILQAIEDGQIDELPGLVYSHSFVRSYCEFLCAEDLWGKYEPVFKDKSIANIHLSSQIEPQKQYTPPARAVFRNTSLAWVYILLLFSVFVAGYLLWKQKLELSSHPFKPPENTVSSDLSGPVSTDLSSGVIVTSVDLSADFLSGKNGYKKSADVRSGDISINGFPSSHSADDKSLDIGWMDGLSNDKRSKNALSSDREKSPVTDGVLTLMATERLWVGIYQGKQTLFSGFLSKGEKKEVLVKARTRVRLGNPGYVRLFWEGTEKLNLGRPGKPTTVYIDVKKNRTASRTQS